MNDRVNYEAWEKTTDGDSDDDNDEDDGGQWSFGQI